MQGAEPLVYIKLLPIPYQLPRLVEPADHNNEPLGPKMEDN